MDCFRLNILFVLHGKIYFQFYKVISPLKLSPEAQSTRKMRSWGWGTILLLLTCLTLRPHLQEAPLIEFQAARLGPQEPLQSSGQCDCTVPVQ